MRIHTERNRDRVNYHKLVDTTNSWLDIQEAKNRNIEIILNELDKNLCEQLCVIPNWKEKHLNVKTISLLEKMVPENVTPQQMYVLIRRFLEYRTDSTDFRRIQNIYTMLRYYENPKDLQMFATNWKDVMSQKRYKS